MNATATHDTKRGEDARLRINLLSEMTEEWTQVSQRWKGQHQSYHSEVTGKHFPTDVLVGYTVGVAVGYLVPKWHEDTNAIQTLDTSDLQEKMILSSLSGIALLAILSRTLGKDDKHCDCCIKTSQIPKKNKWRLTPVTSYYTGLRLTYAL